jgi:phenylpropionate dioxygenase-like ring-hydroxylating dioxygenase large terminal subunit
MTGNRRLASDAAIVERIRAHIANGTTDLADGTWREPVANYRSAERLVAELELLRSLPVAFCPSAALAEPGGYVSRDAGGMPVMAVRGDDGVVRAFRNVCRHRGAAVVCGAGRAQALVCPYHGWTYQLDGRLRGVPHKHGFPGLDLDANGLSALAASEHHGVVFVAQRGPAAGRAPDAGPGAESSAKPGPEIDELAGVLDQDLQLTGTQETQHPVNWKILAETFLEGYHIRSLHKDTFFPVQFDNLNIIESFGPHSRITFPYRNVSRPFDIASRAALRSRLTYVYHLFPNVMIATFPRQVLMVVLEPLATDRTMAVTYTWSDVVNPPRGDPDLAPRGASEDFQVARTIQHGLGSGSNDYLQFGRFEGAIAHFHRTLDAALASHAP